MTEQQLDIKARYSEGCTALRHYSNCVMSMRTVTVAQGIVILSAATYLASQNRFLASILLCVFGLLFTGVLHMLQKSYWEHFENVLRAVVEMETGNKIDDSQTDGLAEVDSQYGVWNVYRSRRKARFDLLWWILLVRHGPFLLLLTSLLALLTYNAYRKLF